MSQKIPMLDLRAQVDTLWKELETTLHAVLRSGRFILGPNVAEFERECSQALGVRECVGVNSGTDALILALRALDIGPGDEVITSAFTFFATAEAIASVGAQPIFADISPESFCLDPESVRASLSPRTRAILPVHLFGHAADMDALLDLAGSHGLRLIEDVAQAFGGRHRDRPLGSLGDAAAFSFFPSKNLGAFGDAGLLATPHSQVAERARALREHGARGRGLHEAVGYNSRLDEIQAAVLRVKLPHLERWNESRRALAHEYDRRLATIPEVRTPQEADYAQHVYNLYTVRLPAERREDVRESLAARGIGAVAHYSRPLHQLDIFGADAQRLPATEQAAREVLSLPLWPELPAEALAEVVAALRDAL
ncbi:MAG: DegT/DnrJ/EryC1/StrS family aminotransferase [Myxococcota bacterium]